LFLVASNPFLATEKVLGAILQPCSLSTRQIGCDPEAVPVGVDVRHYLGCRRSSSAAKKTAADFSIRWLAAL
jgi:hypothetical protein